MATIHDRMPVILTRDTWDVWMDLDVDPAALLNLLVPYEGSDMRMDPANPLVNNVKNQGPELLAPIE